MKLISFFTKSALLLLIFAVASINAQNRIDVLELGQSIFMVRSETKIGNPTSVLLLGKDGVLMVDANLSSISDSIRNWLAAKGYSKIDFIILTHSHTDHVEASREFGKEAMIISRENLRNRLMQTGLYEKNGEKMPPIGLPDITINSEMTLYLNNEEVAVSPLPAGHTDADIIVYFRHSRILCVGDYGMVDKYPLFDFDSGADMGGYFKNIDYILNNYPEDTKIIPGHSTFYPDSIRIISMQTYKQWKEMLLETTEIIKKNIKSGMTLEQLQKTGLPDKFKYLELKPRFVSQNRWIEAVYNSVLAKKF